MHTTNNAHVELHVPDFDTVKEFYGRLGFEVVWEREPEGAKGYLVMEREENVLCFWPGTEEVYDHSYFGDFDPATRRGYGVEIALMVEDIGPFYDRVSGFAEVVEELQERPWGLKDFRITDPFGFYLRFSEPHDIRSDEHTAP